MQPGTSDGRWRINRILFWFGIVGASMWRTQIGERLLQGAEAHLIQTALGVLVDQVEEEIEGYRDQSDFGIPIFDRLDARQKLALLADVCDHLFRSTAPPPKLTATNESAIAVLYEVVDLFVQFEVDDEETIRKMPDGHPYDWRQRVLAAYRECFPDDPEVPAETSRVMEDWELLIECLACRVLWDADFLDEDLYADQSPDKGQTLKARMHVDDDYFRAVAPDPLERDLPGIRERLQSLTKD